MQDFNATRRQLTFLEEHSQCVEISIVNDLVLEQNEIFTIELSTMDPDVVVGIDAATVVIINDDSKYIWYINGGCDTSQ